MIPNEGEEWSVFTDIRYWTGDYVFENAQRSFRTRKNCALELTSVFHECASGRRKLAVEVVDIFGNDRMTIVKVAR